MPPCGELELAVLARRRAREGALLVAEQLALEQVLGQRRAVHLDEAACRARRELVQRARDDLLADAALALDQHRDVGVGDLLEQRAHARIAGAAPRAIASPAGPAPRRERAALALERAALEHLRERAPRAPPPRRACSGSRRRRAAWPRRWCAALPTTESITTGTLGCALADPRAASRARPCPGIITSSSTTSGRGAALEQRERAAPVARRCRPRSRAARAGWRR